MKEVIKKLTELQDLENIRDDIAARLNEIPVLIESENERVSEFQQDIAAVKGEVKSLTLALKDRDMDLKTAEAELRKSSEQLNTLKSNEAYSAMQEKIAAVTDKINAIEDSILQIYEEIEDSQSELVKKESELKVIKAEVEEAQASHRKKAASLEENREEILSRIRPVESEIEQKLLAEYRKIRSARGGIALVEISDGSCGGCHIKLRPQIINEVMQEEKLVSCDNCNRFLYMDY